MKILLAIDNLYPEMGGSYRAITDIQKIILNNEKYKSRIIVNYDGISKKKLDTIFLIKNFDIIHFFGVWSFFHIKIILLGLLFKKKIIITSMGCFDEWSLNQKKIKKKLALYFYQIFFLNRVNVIHTTSNQEKVSLQKICNNKNIITIPHGTSQAVIKSKKFFEGTKKKAIFFSRLHKKKGIEELVESWLNIKNNEWELHIYGFDYDDYNKLLKKKIKNNKSISIFGSISGKNQELFDRYDFMILPSRSENFGYVVLEAMQCGLPVLTTNGTPWHIIEKNNAGWIIDKNLTELESKIKEIFSLPKEEFEKKSAAAINYSKNFFWKNLKKKYFKMYDDIL
ncbi:glycosyltransferase [Candidatus Pelagibacter ubique]|nr:glycosyltransferase [Candidatus Pelagibacter ubique]